jgi:Domain of unknown function (DUF6265)
MNAEVQAMRAMTIVILWAAFSAPATGQPQVTTASLAFLTGCWKFEAKGRVVEEHWMAPSGGSLIGISRTVVNGKTSEFEFLQIRDLPAGLTYIAKPSSQAEARFVATSASPEEIVFENPAHDFPQRIRYRIDGSSLRAQIEGTVEGKVRGVEFPYARVSCVP